MHFRWWVLPLAPWLLARHRREVVRVCPGMGPFFSALDERCGSLSPTQHSHLERADRGLLGDRSLTYGELSWPSFRRLMAIAAPRQGEEFIELGSGQGQFCFFAARHFGMRAVGMERVKWLSDFSRDLAARDSPPLAAFSNMDFLEADFSTGSVLYVTAACLAAGQVERLLGKLNGCASGARVISVGRSMEADFLQLIRRESVRASWGRDTAWVYLRR